MDVVVMSQELEQIGLNKSEIKVYLALLKLGASTTGPIIKESRTANSKIYEVLDKLIQKGLVCRFIKENVNYYKSTNPEMLSEYLDERKSEIETQKLKLNSLLPSLIAFSKEKEENNEAVVFTGPRGVRTAFTNLVNDLNSGEEVHIMGVHDFGKTFLNSALYFQQIRSKKNIKAKFLIDYDAKNIAKEFKKYPPVEIRYLPKGTVTPAIFLIYKDKVIINLAKEMTFFVLTSQSAKDAFEAYFDLLWKTAKKN